MKQDALHIKQAMHEIVEKHFQELILKETTLSFLEVKNGSSLVFGKLVLLHYRMFGGKSPEIFQAAAAIELMILSLDIFDDLQDKDNPTMPWCVIEASLSQNVAIGLLTLSQMVLLQLTTFSVEKKAVAARYFSELVVEAVRGQHIDLLNEIQDEEEYLEMVKHKSGSLIAVACLIGTSLAIDQYHEQVRQYAQKLGVIEQIENDIRDICQWGVKNDLLNKKITLLVLYLQQSERDELLVFKEYFTGRLSRKDLEEQQLLLSEVITSSGAIEYANIIANLQRIEAEEGINSLLIEQRWKKELVRYILGSENQLCDTSR